MKKILLLLSLSLLCINFGIAQDNQYLEVDYEMEIKLDADQVVKNIPAQMRAQAEAPIRAEIKNGIFVDYKLKTDGDKSIYKLMPKIDNTQNGSGFILQQFTSEDKEPMYKDLINKRYKKLNHFFGKDFLIDDTLPVYEWSVTREKDQIAGFEVRKATGKYVVEATNDTLGITAWFAPKLKYKDGPGNAWGLPGLILKTVVDVESQGAEIVIIGRKVDVKTGEFKLGNPTAEKVVTEQEYISEKFRMQKEFQEAYGGGVDTSE